MHWIFRIITLLDYWILDLLSLRIIGPLDPTIFGSLILQIIIRILDLLGLRFIGSLDFRSTGYLDHYSFK